jgi:hypothetical protein
MWAKPIELHHVAILALSDRDVLGEYGLCQVGAVFNHLSFILSFL